MAIQILGQDGASVLQIDPAFDAARVSLRPLEAQAWHSLGVKTGNLTTVAAGGSIFSLRNLSPNPILIRNVGVGFILTTAFTTAQLVELGLVFARAFTSADTGGTALSFATNNVKVRTSLANSSSIEARISTTTALGAGTKTKDANYLAMQSAWCGAVGAGIAPSLNNLFSQNSGDYPLVIEQNEGINIDNVIVMGAAGVGIGYVNVEWAEAANF